MIFVVHSGVDFLLSGLLVDQDAGLRARTEPDVTLSEPQFTVFKAGNSTFLRGGVNSE